MNKSLDETKKAKLTDILSFGSMFKKETIRFHEHVEGWHNGYAQVTMQSTSLDHCLSKRLTEIATRTKTTWLVQSVFNWDYKQVELTVRFYEAGFAE